MPLQFLCLTAVSFGFFKVAEVSGWTYHYSNKTLTWNESHDWCRRNFTDMVAIQNKEEISFLTQYLPRDGPHYWIGLRKKNNIWVWIGTNISLTKNETNWAFGEPNNKMKNQDCVEIYIKRKKEDGKWNDEQCNKKKRPLCYLASCNVSSCNKHGNCIETIQNYTCECWPGFYGEHCENVISCRSLLSPSHGHMICSDIFGMFQYNSVCNFTCREGFELAGTSSLSCENSGNWSESVPTCKAVSCKSLQSPSHGHINCSDKFGKFQYHSVCNFSCKEGFELIGSSSLSCEKSGDWSASIPRFYAQRLQAAHTEEVKRSRLPHWKLAVQCNSLHNPSHGQMNCSDIFGTFQYNTVCNFSCEEGFQLEGSRFLSCQNTGNWSASAPTCKAISCSTLHNPLNGHINCSDVFGEYSFKSVCEFTCKDGFQLSRTNSLLCQNSGEWSESIPLCIALIASSEKQKQTYTEASVLSSLGLILSGLSMAYGIRRYRKKKNTALLKTDKNDVNTFENPAFEGFYFC
ncbi:P-selectin-like [Leptodactylus fuscus]